MFKIFAFVICFFVFSLFVSFLVRDDNNSYSRTLFHEFYKQDNIDYLLCGASHTSHGVEANIAGKYFGKNVFNTGTASQKIDGTYAILRQAVKLYKIEKVFLELDFAITCASAFSERTGLTSEYIVANGIRDLSIKTDYLIHCSTPSHYLNSILPIGKDKLITLNPKKIGRKLKSVITGDYFKYVYYDDDSEYAGKGCVLDVKEIPEGGFSDYAFEGLIDVNGVSADWKNTMEKIIALCKSNNIELILYSMPGSDFYLNQRGNYDEYYAFCRDFAAERGFRYYDFNLAKPDVFALSDSCYHDTNHLSKKGIYVWTDFFCDFFSEKYLEEDCMNRYFCASYAEKMALQEDRIFGLYMITSENKKSLEIIPISNHVLAERIKYDVYALTGAGEIILQEKSKNTIVALPDGKSGKIRVISYIDGIKENDCVENFAAF